MQKWICGVCGKKFEVKKNDRNSVALKEAMKHALEHAKRANASED